MTRDDTEIVSAVHQALAGRVGHERFAIWFGRGVRMEPCGTTLRIAAADRFRLDFMRRQFRDDLLAAARVAVGHAADIEFVLDPALAVTVVPPELPVNSAQAMTNASLQAAAGNASAGTASSALPPPPDRTVQRGPSPQPPSSSGGEFKLPRRRFASLDEFKTSEANRIALTAAQTAATRPGTYSPLTIVGPTGTGKTHLLEGIWRQARTLRSLQRVLYLSAEQFTNQFLDALRESGTPNFRRKVRDAEMLLIDDVHFFAGKHSTLLEVAHTIDALMRTGRQLVFTANRPPAELRGLGQEIVTRLCGGLICTLEPADYSVRLAILEQLAARQALRVPAEVLQWLASQLDGDARLLAGALNRLQAASDAHAEPITLPFAQAALADLVTSGQRVVRLPEIVDAVCDVFGVEEADLQSGSKAASVAVPRMLVMFLARKWTRSALSEISRKLGRKSHSTVLSAQQKIEALLADGKTVRLSKGQCLVEEAIKRVEAQLRLA